MRYVPPESPAEDKHRIFEKNRPATAGKKLLGFLKAQIILTKDLLFGTPET